jgi:hypothetical protein
MSRSATPATRNEATSRFKPPKMPTSAELPRGTAIRSSYGRLRTVADGCDHKRYVERTHPQPPDPQSETGTLATHSGKGLAGTETNSPNKPLSISLRRPGCINFLILGSRTYFCHSCGVKNRELRRMSSTASSDKHETPSHATV